MSPPQSAQNFLDNALVWAFQSYIRECVFHKRNIDVFDSATDMWPSRFDSMGKLQATTHRDTWCKKDVIALVHLRKDLGLPWELLVALFFPSRLVTDCKRAYHIQQGGDHDGIDFEVMAEDTRPTEYCDTEFRSVYRQALAENVRLEFDKVLAAQQLMNYRMELFDKFPGWTNYDKVDLLIKMKKTLLDKVPEQHNRLSQSRLRSQHELDDRGPMVPDVCI